MPDAMKEKISPTVYLTIETDTLQPVEIRSRAKWCFIDWGDWSFGKNPIGRRTYRKRGQYVITITAEDLQMIHISGCKLLFAMFSGCKNLKGMYLNNVGLRSLKLSGCKELRHLSCRGNLLTALDLYGTPRLRRLECGHNQLKSLILWGTSEISYLECNNNRLKELSFPHKNALIRLDCSDNLLSKEALRKILAKLPNPALKANASVRFSGNPGEFVCNTQKIIDRGWKLGRYETRAA